MNKDWRIRDFMARLSSPFRRATTQSSQVWDEPIPEHGKLLIGGSQDFESMGSLFLNWFKELGGLQPNERVLDVGCGIGRMAIPLTRYLNADGSYEGLDIVREGIDWCKRNIEPRYPNFNFQLADIFNKSYNSGGRLAANKYKFPFQNESFDFVFLTSVFTHMLPDDVQNYLRETARVLKHGGRCFITFFLWNEESAGLIHSGKSMFDFRHAISMYHLVDIDLPESAICYDESFVCDLFGTCGLGDNLKIHYGEWCGRTHYVDGQDIVVACKP